MFEYFYGQQAEQFSFYRIPKMLFTDKKFSVISTDAKVLYGILLDRMNLSAKNGWFDENGRVYIIFPIDEIMESLNCGRQKAVKLLDDLEKKSGLIERCRQGLGKPNIIYVKNFVTASSNFKEFENQTSSGMKIEPPEVPKSNCNNINYNNTENINTDLSFPSGESNSEPEPKVQNDEIKQHENYKSYFLKIFSFDVLLEKYREENDILHEILDLIVDTVCTKRKTIRIAGDDKPAEIVRSQFMKLERGHIEFILSCLRENTSKIKNMRQYLLTTIYNAPMTIGNYYSSLAQHHIATGLV